MLEPYGVITAVTPIGGGWRYEQAFQGGFQRIPPKGCAGGPKQLVQQVRQFRANAHIDLGDVELDVAEFIKRESPINNKFKRRKALAPQAPRKKFRPMISRIRDWILSTAPKQPHLLIIDEALQRADICQQCKQNVKWVTGCLPCVEEIKNRGFNLRQRPNFERDDNLGACRLHGFYLPAAVFIDNESLPERHPEAPKPCWVQRNLDNG